MRSILLILSCTLLSGCMNKVGPCNLHEDSLRYNHAVQNSTDSQLLLNIVRLRYRDNPNFLQVGIISSSYDYKRALCSEFKFEGIDSKNFKASIVPKVNLEYTEKPTTTFQPVRGEKFVKEILSPISLETITLLSASGWKMSRIFRCCAQRLNNLRNAPSASGPTPTTAPDFEEFLELTDILNQLEEKDAVKIEKHFDPKTKRAEYFLTFDRNIADPYLLNQVWQRLDVETGLTSIRLVPYHGKRQSRDEIFIDTRSPVSILYFLSHGIHVPDYHESWGKVTVTTDSQGAPFDWDRVLDGVMTIHSGITNYCTPAVFIHYRGNVFYIDDSDLDSKSTFSMLSQMLALQTGSPIVPYLTLPLVRD